MRKKSSVLFLILMLLMNQAAPMGIKAADAADEVKVYVENGEGSLTEGDGTAQRPYQNIRTALKQIQTGQTLVLVGEVSYTKYETYEDESPKPLFIDKDITIVGSDTSAGLKIRSMIQLGADVTRTLRFVICGCKWCRRQEMHVRQQFMRRDIRWCWMR